MDHGTTIQLGLPGMAVDRVERVVGDDAKPARFVHFRTTVTSAAGCPQCWVVSTSVRQCRTTRPRGRLSTRARSTAPPSGKRCRTRSSSSTTSTLFGWPTRPSRRCGSGSSARSWAGAAPPGTRRGRKRRRLLRARERLTIQQFNRVWEEKATGELLATWIAKEELRYLLALACQWCARADVPEVTALAKTIEAWWPQILAFIDTGITTPEPRRRTGWSRMPPASRSGSATSATAPPGTVALQTDDHQSARV
jgi:hypothetical protein